MKNNRIVVKDLGVLSYEDSWEHQKTIFDNIISQKIKNRTLKKKNKTDNYLLIVEHKPIFTIGKSGDTSNLLLNTKQLKSKNIEFKKINRGGDITFHGSGQVVGYPILDLDNFFTDIGQYLRTLEEVIISAIGFFGLKGYRINGETGVWVKDKLNSDKIIVSDRQSGLYVVDFTLDNSYELGDVNDDNSINIFDIIIVVEFILDIEDPSEQEFLLSDVNADLSIDVFDILMIIDIILS